MLKYTEFSPDAAQKALRWNITSTLLQTQKKNLLRKTEYNIETLGVRKTNSFPCFKDWKTEIFLEQTGNWAQSRPAWFCFAAVHLWIELRKSSSVMLIRDLVLQSCISFKCINTYQITVPIPSPGKAHNTDPGNHELQNKSKFVLNHLISENNPDKYIPRWLERKLAPFRSIPPCWYRIAKGNRFRETESPTGKIFHHISNTIWRISAHLRSLGLWMNRFKKKRYYKSMFVTETIVVFWIITRGSWWGTRWIHRWRCPSARRYTVLNHLHEWISVHFVRFITVCRKKNIFSSERCNTKQNWQNGFQDSCKTNTFLHITPFHCTTLLGWGWRRGTQHQLSVLRLYPIVRLYYLITVLTIYCPFYWHFFD